MALCTDMNFLVMSDMHNRMFFSCALNSDVIMETHSKANTKTAKIETFYCHCQRQDQRFEIMTSKSCDEHKKPISVHIKFIPVTHRQTPVIQVDTP